MTWWCDRRLPAASGRGGSDGFTLIELLVVLAVLGLAVGLFAGHKPHWSSTLSLNGAAADLAAGLRLARSEAIARDRPVELEIDVLHHRYRVAGAPFRTIPADLSLRLQTVEGERRGAGAASIRFNPDGSSTGGGISLADGRRRVTLAIDWLNGRVRIADAP
ncbi:MAG TPA: GspH/FimT family protein [Stellaceae bacterium]|nr:GspH/FimT family protein [Stellaceae bacterium]